MLIRLKNKDTLKIDDFSFKCCIGKKGLKAKKVEGETVKTWIGGNCVQIAEGMLQIP